MALSTRCVDIGVEIDENVIFYSEAGIKRSGFSIRLVNTIAAETFRYVRYINWNRNNGVIVESA